MAHTNTFGDNGTPFSFDPTGPPSFGDPPYHCNLYTHLKLTLEFVHNYVSMSLVMEVEKKCQEKPSNFTLFAVTLSRDDQPVGVQGDIAQGKNPAVEEGDICKNFDGIESGSLDFSKLMTAIKDMLNGAHDAVTSMPSDPQFGNPPSWHETPGSFSPANIAREMCDNLHRTGSGDSQLKNAKMVIYLDCAKRISECDINYDWCSEVIHDEFSGGVTLDIPGRSPYAPPISFDKLFKDNRAYGKVCDIADLLDCWIVNPDDDILFGPKELVYLPPPPPPISQPDINTGLEEYVDDLTKECKK
tara:strand:- start:4169 stop:5071 length:903 start_codon:yes stop_codon:yes gene_type:complete